jgi:hypothetical protein
MVPSARWMSSWLGWFARATVTPAVIASTFVTCVDSVPPPVVTAQRLPDGTTS